MNKNVFVNIAGKLKQYQYYIIMALKKLCLPFQSLYLYFTKMGCLLVQFLSSLASFYKLFINSTSEIWEKKFLFYFEWFPCEAFKLQNGENTISGRNKKGWLVFERPSLI